MVPDRLDERQVGESQLRLRAAPPEDVAAQLASALAQLGCEARLVDPGLAGEQDEPSVAAIRREERVLELGHFLLPSDEHRGENTLEHSPIFAGGGAAAPQRWIMRNWLPDGSRNPASVP